MTLRFTADETSAPRLLFPEERRGKTGLRDDASIRLLLDEFRFCFCRPGMRYIYNAPESPLDKRYLYH